MVFDMGVHWIRRGCGREAAGGVAATSQKRPMAHKCQQLCLRYCFSELREASLARSFARWLAQGTDKTG